jgi:ABC-type lipoprotein release transport system permease subunit
MCYVLVALADGLTHGYAILKDVEQITNGSVRLEVLPNDAVTCAGAALFLAALAVAESLIPPWRATRVDPLVAP